MRQTLNPFRTTLAAALVAAATATPPLAQAQLVRATITGTVTAGSDAYSNTVLLGQNDGSSLVGQTASAFIVYDAGKFGPNYPNYAPNWAFYHSPNWPDYAGTQGQSPVVSAGFTIHGITLATDVSGQSENARLFVANPDFTPGYGQPDSWGLYAGDARRSWCFADSQCVETVQLSAYQSAAIATDLFGGQRPFNPADSFSAQGSANRAVDAHVRLYRNTACPVGVCPNDALADGQTHWVEFWIGGPGATVTVAAVVPEPASWTLWLVGIAGLCSLARRRQAGG